MNGGTVPFSREGAGTEVAAGSCHRVPLAATAGSLPPGGSSIFLLNLARALDRRGFTLPVVVLSERAEYQADFARTKAALCTVSTQKYIYEDRLAWGYRQVARFRPCAVLACLSSESYEILRLVPPGVARLAIIQSHDPGPYRLLPHYRPWLDGIAGVSTVICEHLRLMPECAGVQIEHIPYGIDFAPPVPRAPRDTRLPLRVIYLGRLAELQKRISRLAELIRLLEKRQANVRFTIVGTGPDEDSFRASLAGCGIVEFRGAIPNAEVAPLLRQQDVYILLSDFEGLPLSLLEAMAEGVVPVVSDLPGGLREVVTDETGYRVKADDIEAAARIIEGLASEPARLAGMSESAARLVREHYNADLMAERFLRLIDRLAPGERQIAWPAEVSVPPPKLLAREWLHQGWPLKLRRLLKRLRP